MTEPVLVGDVLPEVVAEAIARAGPGYDRWAEQEGQTDARRLPHALSRVASGSRSVE